MHSTDSMCSHDILPIFRPKLKILKKNQTPQIENTILRPNIFNDGYIVHDPIRL